MPTQAKQMKRQTRGKAEPVASEGLKSTGVMGYQKCYHLFSEDWLQEKKKKKKGKCKHHEGELEGEFRSIETSYLK